MKQIIKGILGLSMLLAFGQVSAHYMWIQTSESGQLNKSHEVKVFFGEYTYGVIEDPQGENFDKVKDFRLWVVSPSGKKSQIETLVAKDAYIGQFTPSEKGTYTVVLNNDEIDVIDYTQYDFGIFKSHYHSTAKVVIGEDPGATIGTNETGMVVINSTQNAMAIDEEVTLKVLYKGQAVEKGQEVVVYVEDMWSKTLHADANGEVKFMLPWKTTYTVETTKKEEVPGTYNGEAYEFIWHCATYSIKL
ncbi:MAG: DUF4198 domain-containing protein [Marinoscillum sp.]